jgi:hypothetical protein
MKTEVYSWRVSTSLKSALEREARRLEVSLSAVLDQAASEWLNNNGPPVGSDEAQQRLHREASKCLGAFASGDAHRSENARREIGRRLRQRHER